MKKISVIFLIVIIMTCGCIGGQDADSSTPVETQPANTTSAPSSSPPTTLPPTTSIPTSTQAPTTSPPQTTAAPSTTSPPTTTPAPAWSEYEEKVMELGETITLLDHTFSIVDLEIYTNKVRYLLDDEDLIEVVPFVIEKDDLKINVETTLIGSAGTYCVRIEYSVFT